MNENRAKIICENYGSEFIPVYDDFIIAYSRVNEGNWPLNALRHMNNMEYSGWFIWWGEGDIPNNDDYFKPVHLKHIHIDGVNFHDYIALEPGWRWLLAPNHADVWFDGAVAQV